MAMEIYTSNFEIFVRNRRSQNTGPQTFKSKSFNDDLESSRPTLYHKITSFNSPFRSDYLKEINTPW